MAEEAKINLVVNPTLVRRNADQIRDYLGAYGASLTIATKVLPLSASLIERAGLTADVLYDTGTANGGTILRCGGSLLCAQAIRDHLSGFGLTTDAKLEAYAITFQELAADGTEIPTVYLDIDEGREGFLPEDYARVARLLTAQGRSRINVVCNVRCDAEAEPAGGFFAPLRRRLLEIENLGITLAHISLGGSALLPHLDLLSELREITPASLSVRVGESVFNGTIPGIEGHLPGLDLGNAIAVRLPILQTRTGNQFLVAAGYTCLEQSGIADDRCRIRRQWSEHAVLECPSDFVAAAYLEIPLTYKGAAKLKVNRDIDVILAPS